MTGLRSICNQWRNESQCQNLVPLTSAASSKRVNGLLSSTLACFDSDPFKDNDFVASGTAHFADRRRDVGMESDQISSRNKRSKVDTSKRVNFAETVNIIGCLPYKKGLTDAETIKLYHTDIWYTVRIYIGLRFCSAVDL